MINAPSLTAEPGATGRWFRPEPDPRAPLRLFLFPHVADGGMLYRPWPALLPGDVTSQIVQIPGRQNRRNEPPFRHIEPLLEALYDAMLDELDERPFAFFGHSFGAQLAYRLTVLLERDGMRGPVLFGASAWTPVGFAITTMEMAHMPEAELMKRMRDIGSFHDDAYNDPEMLRMIVPALRADMEVIATYVDDGAAIASPIVAYSGKSDPLMGPESMDAWRPRTPNFLGNSTFPGGHFYVENHDHAVAVVTDLTRHLRRCVAEDLLAADRPQGGKPVLQQPRLMSLVAGVLGDGEAEFGAGGAGIAGRAADSPNAWLNALARIPQQLARDPGG